MPEAIAEARKCFFAYKSHQRTYKGPVMGLIVGAPSGRLQSTDAALKVQSCRCDIVAKGERNANDAGLV